MAAKTRRSSAWLLAAILFVTAASRVSARDIPASSPRAASPSPSPEPARAPIAPPTQNRVGSRATAPDVPLDVYFLFEMTLWTWGDFVQPMVAKMKKMATEIKEMTTGTVRIGTGGYGSGYYGHAFDNCAPLTEDISDLEKTISPLIGYIKGYFATTAPLRSSRRLRCPRFEPCKIASFDPCESCDEARLGKKQSIRESIESDLLPLRRDRVQSETELLRVPCGVR